MAVEAVENSGKTCILDIEMEGVKQVHRSHLKARFLFLQPPNEEELEKRLRGRGTDKEEDILKRLDQAKKELEYAKTEGVHDQVVINDDLDKAYKEVERFCLGED
jgi:guanylate kinase